MIEETIMYIAEKYPKIQCIGLLATDGTIQSKIYHQWAERHELELITPEKPEQIKVMSAIYDYIKKGTLDSARPLLIESAAKLMESGAELIIAGCTEIPLALTEMDITVPLVDPTWIIALKAVEKAT